MRRLAPVLYITIRFSPFPLRVLLARRLASRRGVVVREMRFDGSTTTDTLTARRGATDFRFIEQCFHLISSNLSSYLSILDYLAIYLSI